VGLLRWVEAGCSKNFLKAEIINLHLDFIDLCEGRFWGASDLYFQLKYSIHERIVKDHGWNYQLLAPNGIHIYCKDVEEAKEIAEIMYRRTINALLEQVKNPEKLNKSLEYSKMTKEQFDRAMYKIFCRNTKHKTKKLISLLNKRGVSGKVYYSRIRRNVGWMFVYEGGDPILLGSNYEQALDMIQSGTLDFFANKVG